MAFDPTAYLMPGTGHLWVAPTGTTLPTSWDAVLDPAFEEVGYTSTEGVSAKFGRETKEIEAWQSDQPIDERGIKAPTTFDLQMLEWNGVSLPLAVGGATITVAGTGVKLTPFGVSLLDRRAMVLDVEDGDPDVDGKAYRWVCERVKATGDVSTQFRRTDPALLPISLKALAPQGVGTTGWYLLSNDDRLEVTS